MKKILFAVCGCILFFAACKENDPSLTLPAPSTVVIDTVISIPPAQTHNVLVEEFTGQSCPNCPAAHADLDEQVTSNPGRVNVISLYFTGGPQTVPNAASHHDLRDSTATLLATAIYGGIGFLPSGGIDRTAQNGNLLLSLNSWNGLITSQETISVAENLAVSSTCDTAGGFDIATITASVIYTQSVSGKQYLSVALVEDSIVDLQEDNTAASGLDTSYIFTSVFRGLITDINGTEILSTYPTKQPGLRETRTFTYVLPKKSPAIVPAHCRIIAFVTGDSNVPVLQSQQCPLLAP